MKLSLVGLLLSLLFIGCKEGQDVLRIEEVLTGTIPSGGSISIGSISPSTKINGVEVAPATNPTAFRGVTYSGHTTVNHGGSQPGYIHIPPSSGSAGDTYRITLFR